MKDRKQTFRESGVELYQQIQPVEVIVDASLIKEALAWAVKSSQQMPPRLTFPPCKSRNSWLNPSWLNSAAALINGPDWQ